MTAANASSPITAFDTNSCTSPERSRTVAKINLPESRSSMMRPATRTRSSVSVPASRPPHVDRSSPRSCVRSKRYGYGSVPVARIPSTRPSRRARSAARPLPVARPPRLRPRRSKCHLPRWQHGSEFSPPRRIRFAPDARRRRRLSTIQCRATSDGPSPPRRGPALDAGRRPESDRSDDRVRRHGDRQGGATAATRDRHRHGEQRRRAHGGERVRRPRRGPRCRRRGGDRSIGEHRHDRSAAGAQRRADRSGRLRLSDGRRPCCRPRWWRARWARRSRHC